jgi:hypothetical protein
MKFYLLAMRAFLECWSICKVSVLAVPALVS